MEYFKYNKDGDNDAYYIPSFCTRIKIIVTKEQIEELRNFTGGSLNVYFNQSQKRPTVCKDGNYTNVSNILYNVNYKEKRTIHFKNIKYDYRKENVEILSMAQSRRIMRPRDGRKFKGACIHGRDFTPATRIDLKGRAFFCHCKDSNEAASIYNFVFESLGFYHYSNDVYKLEPKQEHFKFLERIKEYIKEVNYNDGI